MTYTYYLDIDVDFKTTEIAQKFMDILEQKDIEISEVAYDSFSMIVFDATDEEISDLNNLQLTKSPINQNLSEKNEINYYLSVIQTNSDYDGIPLNQTTIEILTDAAKKAEQNKIVPLKSR